MPVRLNQVPGPLPRPDAPYFLRWLLFLPFCLLVGALLTVLLQPFEQSKHTTWFWTCAILFPFLFWMFLLALRYFVYQYLHVRADAWDERREQVLLQEIERGRRAFHVLGAYFHSSLASEHVIPMDDWVSETHRQLIQQERTRQQLEAFINHSQALKAQVSYQGGDPVKHSHMLRQIGEDHATHLCQLFQDLLQTLAPTLEQLPSNWMLRLLLEVDTILEPELVQTIWQQAWQQVGIPRPLQHVEGNGLTILDDWLDRWSEQKAALLVVSVQIYPKKPLQTTESIVGLVLSNRWQKNLHTCLPLACLHRPEAVPTDHYLEGVQQSLNWVPIQPDVIQHLWLAGLNIKDRQAFSYLPVQLGLTGISEATIYNLDEQLGHPGCAAPWLSIAAAVALLSQQPAAHLVVSGDPQTLWSTVVAPCS